MSMMQFLSTFRLYGPMVLLLAGGVTLLCSLLKKTVLKNCNKKLFVFLPFAVGIAAYAAYRAILYAIWREVEISLTLILEGGFGCGCAATLYYVAYEQFFKKGKTTASPVLPLLEGTVSEEKREECASVLYAEGMLLPEEELSPFVEQTLRAFAPDLSDGELALLTALIVRTLNTLREKQ